MTTTSIRERIFFAPTTSQSLLYWTPTLLLALLFFGSFVLTYSDLAFSISEQQRLGYPGWTSPISAVLKVLGVGTLLVNALTNNRFRTLTYFVFAGFLYDMLLALGGHIATSDSGIWLAIVGLIIWVPAFTVHQLRFVVAPARAEPQLIR